jgi:hypothetical protein
VQPGTRVRPVTVSRRGRDAKGVCDLGNRQADEVTQFHQAGLDGIDQLETFEGLVDGEDVERRLRLGNLDVVERLSLEIAAVSLAEFPARLVDKDPGIGDIQNCFSKNSTTSRTWIG